MVVQLVRSMIESELLLERSLKRSKLILLSFWILGALNNKKYYFILLEACFLCK